MKKCYVKVTCVAIKNSLNIKDYYGKWISSSHKPNDFNGISDGDFVAVKVVYADGEYDIKIGWYWSFYYGNSHNICIDNVEGDYEIVAWCPIAECEC